jgi:hypothetical protein
MFLGTACHQIARLSKVPGLGRGQIPPDLITAVLIFFNEFSDRFGNLD